MIAFVSLLVSMAAMVAMVAGDASLPFGSSLQYVRRTQYTAAMCREISTTEYTQATLYPIDTCHSYYSQSTGDTGDSKWYSIADGVLMTSTWPNNIGCPSNVAAIHTNITLDACINDLTVYYTYNVFTSSDIKPIVETTYHRDSNCSFATQVTLWDASVNDGCRSFGGGTSIRFAPNPDLLTVTTYGSGDCSGSASGVSTYGYDACDQGTGSSYKYYFGGVTSDASHHVGGSIATMLIALAIMVIHW